MARRASNRRPARWMGAEQGLLKEKYPRWQNYGVPVVLRNLYADSA